VFCARNDELDLALNDTERLVHVVVHVIVDGERAEDQLVQLEPTSGLAALHSADDAQLSDREALAFIGGRDERLDRGHGCSYRRSCGYAAPASIVRFRTAQVYEVVLRLNVAGRCGAGTKIR
jgi:hypothetical protein